MPAEFDPRIVLVDRIYEEIVQLLRAASDNILLEPDVKSQFVCSRVHISRFSPFDCIDRDNGVMLMMMMILGIRE